MKSFSILGRLVTKVAHLLPCLAFEASLQAQDLVVEKAQGPWVSSREYLQQDKPEIAEFQMPFFTELKRIAVKSLSNPEQAKEIQRLQAVNGMRSKEFGDGFLTPHFVERPTDAESTKDIRATIAKNMRTYAGKEVRFDFIPESLKSGLRFDFSKKSASAPAPRRAQPVRYGLILKDIEPNEEKFSLAALGNDYALVEHAPKAQLHYEIGPLPMDEGSQNYAISLANPSPAKRAWTSYLPDHRFRGKISPKGIPMPDKPIPDQVISLEQVEGYYTNEIQFVNGKVNEETLLHRFRLPIYERTNIFEEYDNNFHLRKAVLSDYVYYGPFGTNIEHYFKEKRYQAGFFYRLNYTQIQLIAHTPEDGLARDVFWHKHRWDLGFQTAF